MLPCKYCHRRCEPGLTTCRQHRSRRSANRSHGFSRRKGKRSKPGRPRDNFLASPEWRRLKAEILARARRCLSCGGRVEAVDHILPRSKRPELALSESNLQALCQRCHGWKTSQEKSGWVYDWRRGVKRRFAPGERWEL